MPKKSEILFPLITLASGRQLLPHYIYGNSSIRSGDTTVQLAADGAMCASLPYAPHTRAKPTEWVERPLWAGTLWVAGYHGGRSSSCYEVIVERQDGPPILGLMSCLQFLDLIPHIVDGKVTGQTFTAVKRGQNYLIQVIA
jgi:hypothetical protein